MKILHTTTSFILSGHFANLTFQVRSDGKNIVFKRPSFDGLENTVVQAMIARYNSLSVSELMKWENIALKEKFYTRYQAFASSFFLYASMYGIGKAIVDPIPYMFSESRLNRIKQFLQNISKCNTLKEEKSTIKETSDFLKQNSKKQKHFFILPLVQTADDITKAIDLNLIY